MGLEAGIWASRLGFGPQDWDLRGGDVGEGEGEGENPPYAFTHMCPCFSHPGQNQWIESSPILYRILSPSGPLLKNKGLVFYRLPKKNEYTRPAHDGH